MSGSSADLASYHPGPCNMDFSQVGISATTHEDLQRRFDSSEGGWRRSRLLRLGKGAMGGGAGLLDRRNRPDCQKKKEGEEKKEKDITHHTRANQCW
jgi:hypothetical protein